MKIHGRYFALVCLLYLTSTACKKEFDHQKDDVLAVTANSSVNQCKAIALGKATRESDGSISWKNLLLKWYDNYGKLKNVKIELEWYPFQPGGEFTLDYGELTYQNNHIKLNDVFHNQEVLSVDLDEMGRPLISRYDHHGRGGTFQWDTSYYYYSSANRLESIVSRRRAPIQVASGMITWNFTYDPAGNLVLLTNSFGETYEFRYDYTQLNHGMLTLHMLSAPTKILEYLDLLQFEQHHQISSVLWRAGSGYPVIGWGYFDLVRDEGGRVTYYNSGYPDHSYYTAWDCGGNSIIQGKNPTQAEFMRLLR